MWVVAVEVDAMCVWKEGEGTFFLVPEVVDGGGHVRWAEVVHVRQVGVFPFGGDACVGDEAVVSDGEGDAAEQVFGDVEQPFRPFGVRPVVAVGEVVGAGEVAHVVVAVKQHDAVAVFFFVFGDFQEVPFEFLEGVVAVGVEEIADEDVDAVFVHETFPSVPTVDVADDVVGGHGVI